MKASLNRAIVFVETPVDDLWIGEKFQSSWEIAGSPRNSFRASVCYSV